MSEPVSDWRYVEPARTYGSTLVLFAVLVVGFLADMLLGGGPAHVLGWTLAIALVVGVDALIVYAARSTRSIVVTRDELRVGEESVPREQILTLEQSTDLGLPVLGRRYGEGVPRGMVGLAVQLADGTRTVVATRRPGQLLEALDVTETSGPPPVRRAEPSDLAELPEIDRRAELLFRVYGVDLPQLQSGVDAMHDAVAVFVAGRPPVGFVQVDEVDGHAHVKSIAVLPAHMRQGLGSALIDTACAWSAGRGYREITLTTFADIPWNAPFYAACGFAELTELTPELVELRDWERDVGLDRVGRRIVMWRELVAPSPSPAEPPAPPSPPQ